MAYARQLAAGYQVKGVNQLRNLMVELLQARRHRGHIGIQTIEPSVGEMLLIVDELIDYEPML